MADIFISYSSKDREQALQLIELLASAGLSVWIDQSGIDVATSWSGEIVDAIEGCKAFVVLLSPNSILSENVIKEVSLAAEQKKKILPLDLEPVELPRDLKYHLAGIQRAPMTNIDAIIRAIGKLGLEATQAPTLKLVKETDSRKSLMILPFEDLSPTGDNGWFVDGVASELVNTLSQVKAVSVIDWNTSRMLKGKSIRTVDIAKDFSVRYFIEGQVRKFGDNIKISVTLLDIETGDHLWQDNLKGTMTDIFDIQEQTAVKVLEGLKVHITGEEKKKIKQKHTDNPEAFEVYLKAGEYFRRHTKSGYDRALLLFEEAVRLDPNFDAAYANTAIVLTSMYTNFDRKNDLLERADMIAEKVRALDGESAQYFWVMGTIALERGDNKAALEYGKRSIEVDPSFSFGYETVASAYQSLGNYAERIAAREEVVRLAPNSTISNFNLLASLNDYAKEPDISDAVRAEREERLREAAKKALPVYQRYDRLNHDDYHGKIIYAVVLNMAGQNEESLAAAEELSKDQSLDGVSLYNLACLFISFGSPERGMEHLRRAVDTGMSDIEHIMVDPDFEQLHDLPEFKALIKELEEKLRITN